MAIGDTEVVKNRCKTHPLIVQFTDSPQARVAGTAFEMTPEELEQADRDEIFAYKRVHTHGEVVLK